MSLGEILDHAFQIYRSYFFSLLGLAVLPLIVQMALFLLGFPLDGLVRQTTLSTGVQRGLVDGYHWVTTHSSYYLDFVMWPVFCAAAEQIILRQECRVRDALQAVRPRWRGLLTIAGVFWLLGSALPGWLLGAQPMWQPSRAVPFWLSFIMSPIESFALTAPLILGLPIWTIERTKVTEALARSWTLSKGAYGRMFVTFLLQAASIWSVNISIRAMLSLTFYLMAQDHIASLLRSIWIFLPTYIASIIVGPLFPIATTLIYYDQRIRLEGLDIELMMDVAGMTAPAPEQALTMDIARTQSEEMQG